MRGTFFFVLGSGRPSARERAEMTRFSRLTVVAKLAGHRLDSPADLPSKVS